MSVVTISLRWSSECLWENDDRNNQHWCQAQGSCCPREWGQIFVPVFTSTGGRTRAEDVIADRTQSPPESPQAYTSSRDVAAQSLTTVTWFKRTPTSVALQTSASQKMGKVSRAYTLFFFSFFLTYILLLISNVEPRSYCFFFVCVWRFKGQCVL